MEYTSLRGGAKTICFGRAVVHSSAMTTPIANVSDTAYWVAHYRAVESARPDALFADSLAARLVGSKGRDMSGRISRSQYTAWSVVVRTRIIDDYIRQLVAAGIDTVV